MRAPRLRWSAPDIRRLGKSCGAVLDALERAGGRATVAELADALRKTRTRDLRRRTIARLEAAGVVECSGDIVALTGDWLDALNREREIAGEIDAFRRDMARYAREREAYRCRGEKPQRAATEREMCQHRQSYPARRRAATERAIARLFAERPEYRGRRVGQITARLVHYIGPDFPRGSEGVPKDSEVQIILDGHAA